MGLGTDCLLPLRLPPPPRPPPPRLLFSPKLRVLSCSFSLAPPSLSPSPTHIETTLSLIHNSGIIACLRASSAELAYEAASAELRGGISVLEITMSTPGVFEVLGQLVQEHPTVALGVGTVLNAKDARKAVCVGAKFLMSPAAVKDIMDDLQVGDVVYIPGVMTPTEILSAYDAGAKVVKTGSTGDYISAGASSVVLSDAIFSKEAMVHKNLDSVYQLARLASLNGKEAVGQYVKIFELTRTGPGKILHMQ